MDKIIDNLYIGTAYEAIGLFKSMGEFGAVLSIGAEFVEDVIYKEYFLTDKAFPHLIISLWDRSKNIEEAIDCSVKFIDENIDKPVFVHCAAGVSRSPSIVFAYLVYKGMKPIKAFELLTSTRTCTNPYFGFIKTILKHYHYKNNEIDEIMNYIKSGVSQ